MFRMFAITALILSVVIPEVSARGTQCLARWIPDNPELYQYNGQVDIIATDQLNVVKKCTKLLGYPASPFSRGCARLLRPNYCRIITVSSTYKCATPQAVIEHERYHCGGWRHG